MFKIIALIVLCIVHTACSTGEQHYFPLAAGKTWAYMMHYQTMDGEWSIPYVVSSISNHVNNKGEKIHLRKAIDGREFSYTFDSFGLKMLQRTRHHHEKVNPTVEALEQYVYQVPLKKGKRWKGFTKSQVLIKTGPPWKTEFRIVTRIPVESEIESINETISVPAGIFEHCMKIRTQGSIHYDAGNYVGVTLVSINENRWYCPNIGMVKSIRHESTTDETVTHGMMRLELERYQS